MKITKDDWQDALIRTAAALDSGLRLGGNKFNLWSILEFAQMVEYRQSALIQLQKLQEFPFEVVEKIIEARGPISTENGHYADGIGFDKEFTNKLNALVPEDMRIPIHPPEGQMLIGAEVPARIDPENPSEREQGRRLIRRMQELLTTRLLGRFDMPEVNRDELMIAVIDNLLNTLFAVRPPIGHGG